MKISMISQPCQKTFLASTDPQSITDIERLKVLRMARYLATDAGKDIGYTAANIVSLDDIPSATWSALSHVEKIAKISRMRCDGVVETAYEFNSLNVWGKMISPYPDAFYPITEFLDDHNLAPIPSQIL